MLKYVDTRVCFAEIPDEITLCMNLSNCPCHCEGCHSPHLAGDIGEVLTITRIEKLLKENKGVTAICFMGGDNDPKLVNHYAGLIKKSYVEEVELTLKVNEAVYLHHKGISLNPGDEVLLMRPMPNPIKVGWYSGREKIAEEIDLNNFDYIKVGSYKKEYGPLTERTTNQRFYEVVTVPPEETETNLEERWLVDITEKFWKHD